MLKKNSKKKNSIQRRQNIQGYAFIMPWLLGLFLFTLIPMIFFEHFAKKVCQIRNL